MLTPLRLSPEPRRTLQAARPLALGTLSTSDTIVGALVAVLPATCHAWRQRRLADPMLLLIWLVTLWVLRLGRRMQKQARSLRSIEDAAVEGSLFASIGGLAIHHVEESKPAAATAVATPPLLLHLNHGFGANALTWDPLLAPLTTALSERGRGRVPVRAVAHDRIGFGLSQRPKRLEQYGERFQAEVALRLLDHVSNTADAGAGSSAAASSSSYSAAPATVLVGHSIGGLLSARMAVQQRGGGVRGLVLIAPAILASSKSGSAAAAASQRSTSRLARAARAATALGTRITRAVLLGVLLLLEPFLRVLITLLIAQPRFWANGVGAAYADKSRLEPAMLLRYRWPVQVKGSAAGVLRFVRAQLLAPLTPPSSSSSSSSAAPGSAAAEAAAEAEAPLWESLRRLRLPILIIHGERDLLVPLSNSRRLARAMPTASLLELPDCGHCPHEEKPDEVCDAVCDFVATLGLVGE